MELGDGWWLNPMAGPRADKSLFEPLVGVVVQNKKVLVRLRVG
jgi:hypothetical protein